MPFCLFRRCPAAIVFADALTAAAMAFAASRYDAYAALRRRQRHYAAAIDIYAMFSGIEPTFCRR